MMIQPYKVAAVQAAPEFLNLAKGIEKTIKLIDEAGQKGVKLIVFPETWLPGYPWWIWLGAPAWGMQFVGQYFTHSIERDSEEDEAIREAVKRNNLHAIVGVSEREGGSLYISQWHYGPDGKMISRRRKLKPTHVERTVFGNGDGSDMVVKETELGRIGALCCWEHLQPLSKFALYSQHEQVHAACWPAFSLYLGAAFALGPELNIAAAQLYAAEGQCFVVSSCGMVSKSMFELLCDTPDKQQLLKTGGGYARIFGPDGSPLVDPILPTKEGLLISEIDLGMIAYAKAAADPVGHYARPDVVRLMFNNKPSSVVMPFDQGFQLASESQNIMEGADIEETSK